VFGGPVPSHREYVEMILRTGAVRRGAQPVKKTICVARAAIAPNNLMHLIDATVPEQRCQFEQDAQTLRLDARKTAKAVFRSCTSAPIQYDSSSLIHRLSQSRRTWV
jgi:hypothetical protein